MYFNFSKFWYFLLKLQACPSWGGHIDYCSASTEIMQNTMRLFVNRLILLQNLWKNSLVLCGKLLFTLVSDSVIQSSRFMIIPVSFAVSGLTTTWALNLKHFSQWQFLTVVFIAGFYKAKSKTVSVTAEGAIWSNITFLNLCFYDTGHLLAFVIWNNSTVNSKDKNIIFKRKWWKKMLLFSS